LEYDDALTEIFKKNISDEDKSDAESLSAKLDKITTEHKLDERAIDMYMAHVGCDALKTIGASLLIYAAMADDTDDVVEHFFDLLFPAKRGSRIGDFGIDSKTRYALIDELFTRIKDTGFFVSLINNYVEVNPYFRRYPL